LSVADLFGDCDDWNDEMSSCKKTRAGSLPVAHVSYVCNSTVSNCSGLTPTGPVEQVNSAVASTVVNEEETSEELMDVAS
jgi:hypothetical protein